MVTRDDSYAVLGSLDNNIWLAKFAPESNTSPDGSDTTPTSWITAILIIVVVIVVIDLGLLVYFIKQK